MQKVCRQCLKVKKLAGRIYVHSTLFFTSDPVMDVVGQIVSKYTLFMNLPFKTEYIVSRYEFGTFRKLKNP